MMDKEFKNILLTINENLAGICTNLACIGGILLIIVLSLLCICAQGIT